ncbi:MAG: hypothetical protein F4Y92_06960 [Dehalococcoidia bacterium]|nr:hypothetical protein [Dehalococcoidia bacterium]
MTVERYRVRVNPATGEFEIEGSEEFVEKYWDVLQPLVTREPGPVHDVASQPPKAPVPEPSGRVTVPESFGEYWSRFGKLTDVDKALVAGHFVQEKSDDDLFSTRELNKLLRGQGVKVSNPSQAVSANLSAKKVFKEGKGFRVSEEGEERVRELIEKG